MLPAGLSYSVNNSTTGLLITAAGYSHKLLTLLDAVLDKLASFTVQEDRFQVTSQQPSSGCDCACSSRAAPLPCTSLFDLCALMRFNKALLLVAGLRDCWRLQVQRERVAKEYANLRQQQPYERALYDQEMALELRRWHVSEYEAVVGDLSPADLQARRCSLHTQHRRLWSEQISLVTAYCVSMTIAGMCAEQAAFKTPYRRL